jgi:general secretion pathway protein J
MTRDFEQLYILQPPRYQPPVMGSIPDPYRFVGGDTASDVQGFSRIEFSSLNHARIGADQRFGVARIIYYVRPNAQQGYDLCRSDRLESGDQDINMCNDPVLLRHVTGFDIRFRDALDNEYQQWDSESDQFQYAFPSALEIKITFQQEPVAHTFNHLIRIPVQRKGKE